MNEIFSKWYSKIDKSLDQTRLEARIALIKEIAEDSEAPHLYDFFYFVSVDSISNQELIDYITDKLNENEDENIEVGKNEILTLCYGVLLYFATNGTWDEILKTVYLIRIQSYKDSVSPMMDDLISKFSQLPESKSVSSRRTNFNSNTLKKEFEVLEPTMSQNIGGHGAAILKTMKALQTQIQNLSYDLGQMREENQLLWWLRSKYLTSLSVKLEDLLPPNRLICGAYDIVNLSSQWWPPHSISEFLLEGYNLGDEKSPKNTSFKNILENLTTDQAAKILGPSFNNENETFKKLSTVLNTLNDAYLVALEKKSPKIKLPKPLPGIKENISVESAVDILISELAIARVEINHG